MASARKVRDFKYPQTDFEIPLAEAVADLVRANQIQPADQWSFTVRGDVLVITRIRAVEIAGPPDP